MEKGQGGWLHRHPYNASLGEIFSEEREKMRKEYEDKRAQHIKRQARRLAKPEELDRFHNHLLSKFPLTEEDKRFLISKGIQDFSDFGTLPPSTHDIYTNHQLHYIPPVGVAGVFYSWDHKKAFVNAFAYGIFRVVRNAEGLAVGAEVRLSDDCNAKRKAKGYQESRFEPLSSSGKEQGISADTKQYAVIRAKQNSHPDSILLTEGINKADIAGRFMQMDAVGIRSVANWRRFVDDVIAGKFPHVKRIFVAFDMDRFSNPQVMRHHQDCLRGLKGLVEIEINDMSWEYSSETGKHKGLDDCFLAGEKPTHVLYHKPVYLYNLDTISDGIQRLVKTVMHNPNSKINIISATVGGGKTTGVINTINEAIETGNWFKVKDDNGNDRDARVLWLADNHKLLKESFDKFIEKPAMLKGRNQDELDPFYCAEFELTQHVGQQGQNITAKVCLECPLFTQGICSYQNNTKRILKEDRFVMSTKSSFFNKSERIEQFDVIVVDESLNGAIYEQKSISLADIALHQRVLAEGKAFADQKYGRSGEIQKAEMLLEWFQTMLEESDKSPNAKVVKIDIPAEFQDIYSKHERVIIQETDEETGSPETHLKLFMADLDKSAVYVWKDRIIMDTPNYDLMDRLNGKTVLNLDATASENMLLAFGPDKVIHHEFQLKEYINIIQDSTLKCSKGQLADEKIQEKLLSAIEYIAKEKPEDKVSLLSSKFFIEEIAKPYFEKKGINIKMGWYGYHSKGFNFMEDSDTLILVGNFCRNLSVMEMRQQTLAHMNIHVDLEDLIEEDSLGELIQSIGRGRACRRQENPLNLFLFTNRDVSRYYPNTKKIRAFDVLKKSALEMEEQNGAQMTVNEKVAEEAFTKVKSVVYSLLEPNQLICNLQRSRVIDKTLLCRDTVVKYMKKLYSDQLLALSKDEGNQCMELIEHLAHEFRQPNWSEMIALGLNLLTHHEAGLLNNIDIAGSLRVNRGNSELYRHLIQNPPAVISKSLWQRGLLAMYGKVCGNENLNLEEGGAENLADHNQELDSSTELANAMGMTRQSAAKFFNVYKIQLLDYIKERHSEEKTSDCAENTAEEEVMLFEVPKKMANVEDFDASILHHKNFLANLVLGIADAWHRNKLAVREVSVVSQTIHDEVTNLYSLHASKMSPAAKLSVLGTGVVDTESLDHLDFFIATRNMDDATQALLKAKVIDESLPAEYHHPAYYLEQIANSLKLLHSDSFECYNLCKTIYINWRAVKLKERDDD
jgi:hypothetical protein